MVASRTVCVLKEAATSNAHYNRCVQEESREVGACLCRGVRLNGFALLWAILRLNILGPHTRGQNQCGCDITHGGDEIFYFNLCICLCILLGCLCPITINIVLSCVSRLIYLCSCLFFFVFNPVKKFFPSPLFRCACSGWRITPK